MKSSKTPIRKRKNLFIGSGMRMDFSKEDYKNFEKILQNYAKTNKWELGKEKVGNEGYSIMITSKSTSAEEVLNFIKEIKSLFGEIQKEWGDDREVYPDNYTNIKYYGLGGDEENLLLGIHRFSEMMVINILSKNAVELDKEDPKIAHEIFGDYAVDGGKLLNVRVVNDDKSEGIFSKIKNLFGNKND